MAHLQFNVMRIQLLEPALLAVDYLYERVFRAELACDLSLSNVKIYMIKVDRMKGFVIETAL